MFDLSKNNLSDNAEVGYTFELVVPGSAKSTDAFITVRGVQSKVVQAAARKKYKEAQREESMARKRGKDVPEKELEELEDDLLDMAVLRVIGWKGIANDGVELQFTAENVRSVLKEHTWIRDAVLKESAELENFCK